MKIPKSLIGLFLVGILAAFGCMKDPVSSGNPAVSTGDNHVYFASIPDDSVVDFRWGYAPQNSKITHIFWLHNTGEDSLEILSVVPG